MGSAAAVAIGNFDGVHLGHQAVLEEVRRKADRDGLIPVAFTLDIPPRCLSSERSGAPRPRCILSPSAIKSALLGQTVDRIVSVPFASVRELDPERFVLDILDRKLHTAAVVVGDGFRFGAERTGDAAEIRRILPTGNVTSVPAVLHAGEPISSSRIRTHLRHGRIDAAAALLGRFPIFAGAVTPGDRIGRRLGVPTLNLLIPEEALLPPDGVYASWCFAEGQGFPAATYVGSRPTFAAADRRFEVHLLRPVAPAFRPRSCEVHIISCIRADHRFPSQQALKQQIQVDLDDIERRFDPPFLPPEPVLG